MEVSNPTPEGADANIHKSQALLALSNGRRRTDLRGISSTLDEYYDDLSKWSEEPCRRPVGNPEARGNEIYEYELPADVIERTNLGFGLDELPPFMGIKGGAARQVLEALVHSNRQLSPPRDVDLVILEEVIASGNYNPNEVQAVASDLSMHFSPCDAMNGYGAEYIESIADFMRQHDFTINQVLVCKNGEAWKLLASTQAVLDAAEHVVRPTVFEHDPDHDYWIGNKLALKAVRLLSDMQVQGIDGASIRGVQLPDDIYGNPRDDYFMQVLQLDKALEVSIELAERYRENLKLYGMMPYGCEDMNVVDMYHELVSRTNFIPSDGALKVLQIEKERQTAFRCTGELSDIVERLLRQVPDQFSRDYYDTKK